MHGCQACQDQMLELLYDLLDDQERQALLAHLTACPACQAGLAASRQQQRLLAAAARMEFPGVHFAPPQPEPAAQPAPVAPAPAVLASSVPPNSPRPFGDSPARWRRLRRWAAAAAL